MARKIAKQLYPDGHRWGRVQVSGVGVVRQPKSTGHGYRELIQYRLKCECGRTRTIMQTVLEDKGRKVAMDCGRCGLGQWDVGAVPVRIQTPMKVLRRVRRLAEKEGMGLSMAMARQIDVLGLPFDWRVWNGEHNLPKYCYMSATMGAGEWRVSGSYCLPSKMAGFLRKAARLYEQPVSRIFMGLLTWKWERDLGVEDRWQLEHEDEELGGDALYLAGAEEI